MRFDFPCQEHGRTGCRECRRAYAHERDRERLDRDHLRGRSRLPELRAPVVAAGAAVGAIVLAWWWIG